MGAATPNPGTIKPAADGSSSAIFDCRILVVEDTDLNRRIIGGFLKSAGFKQIEFAEDGVIGLQKIDSFQPDLVILDIVMPNMDGFEVLRNVRGREDLQGLPVLVQTALEEPEQRGKVFEVGATDLIAKPINKLEMIARVKIHLENRIFIRDLQAFRRRIDQELTVARNMQVSMMPQPRLVSALEEKFNVDIKSHFETSSELGGDFWGIVDLEDNRIGLFMVDFSGHGVTAALNTFRLHTVMTENKPPADDPASYLDALNRRLKQLLPPAQFCTMIYGVFDFAAETFTYSAAASPCPVLLNWATGEFEMIEASGVPLGITTSATYTNRQLKFTKDHAIFIYSDALTETLWHNGQALFDEGLMAKVEKLVAAQTNRNILPGIIDEFLDNVDRPLPDDLTAVCLVPKLTTA